MRSAAPGSIHLISHPRRSPVVARRSRSGVVSPRSIACWMASSICSGCEPDGERIDDAASGVVTMTAPSCRTSFGPGGFSTACSWTSCRAGAPSWIAGG